MRSKRAWISYLLGAAVAAVIALMVISSEMESFGTGTAMMMHYISDGCFTAAVLYIGCGLLMIIADAGGFYAFSYLGHVLVCKFSFRKDRFEERKNYYDYCTEKKAKQKERGKSSLKWVLLLEGLGCLLLSGAFAVAFYRLADLTIRS